MLIKANNFEVQTASIKLKGRTSFKVNNFEVKMLLPCELRDNEVEVVIPNTSGYLSIDKAGIGMSSFRLLKNEPADLTVTESSVVLTTDKEHRFEIDGNVTIYFRRGIVEVDYKNPLIKKILKVAKNPITRHDLFKEVLSKEEYHRFIYGSGRRRTIDYYDKYLWPLVDDGKLKSVDGLGRRYTKVFQTV
jgi:hypothetical protein